MRAYVYTRTILGSALAGLRQRLPHDERGMQTVEWVGIGGVAAALVGAIIAAIGGVGADVADAVQALIDQATGGAGAAGEVGAGVDAGEPEIYCVRAPCPGPN
jgi:hypothetical protein